MWTLLLSLALAADPLPELTPGSITADSPRGKLGDRLGWGDGADLILLYGGEQAGRVGPCGCEDHPIGGLPRTAGYRAALAKANPGVPLLLLNPGHFYSARTGDTVALAEHALYANTWMHTGLNAGGWDALNVTCRDVPGSIVEGFPEGVLSTNLRLEGLPTHRIVESGGLSVAVLGVATPCLDYLQPEGLSALDPLEAVAALAPTLEADLVVVLASDLSGRVEDLARLDGVDVVLEAGEYAGRYDPFEVDGTLWLRSLRETQRLKELRLQLSEGRVSAARDRTITLDDKVPDDRALKKLLAEPLSLEARAR